MNTISTLWNKGCLGKSLVVLMAVFACGAASAVFSTGRRPAAAERKTYVAHSFATAKPTAETKRTLESVSRMVCGSDFVSFKEEDAAATVVCKFNPQINDETMAVGVMMNFKSLAKEAWQMEPELNRLNLHLMTKFQDKLGNEYEQRSVLLSISGGLARKINWKNVGHRDLPALLAEYSPETTIWVHAIFQNSFLEMSANR